MDHVKRMSNLRLLYACLCHWQDSTPIVPIIQTSNAKIKRLYLLTWIESHKRARNHREAFDIHRGRAQGRVIARWRDLASMRRRNRLALSVSTCFVTLYGTDARAPCRLPHFNKADFHSGQSPRIRSEYMLSMGEAII